MGHNLFLKLVHGCFNIWSYPMMKTDSVKIFHILCHLGNVCVSWKYVCFWSISSLFNLVLCKIYIEKMLGKLFECIFFWCPYHSLEVAKTSRQTIFITSSDLFCSQYATNWVVSPHYDFFVNCYLDGPQPTLGHCWGAASLTQC